ncbi:MAG: hypothetical protein ACO270_11785, partial [Burkholderiaceae bacterium]
MDKGKQRAPLKSRVSSKAGAQAKSQAPFIGMICAVHALCVGSPSNAWAQQERLEVRSSSLQAEAASLTGFGSPLQNLPFAITNIDTEALKSFGLQALSDV